MELISPIQRYIRRGPDLDENNSELDDSRYETYTEADLNPLLYPCGGAKAGRVHFDAEMGSKAYINWRTIHPDDNGMCTLRLGESANDKDYDILYPTDGSGNRENHGKFPCGRNTAAVEGKEIRVPRNLTCDSCILQMEWETSMGKRYMCADIEILFGKIADCSGQCMNGGVCLNGKCKCRAGFEGDFCQIVEYVPAKTNYTKYLKIFLFYMIMILVSIGLLFAGYLLSKAGIEKIREYYANRPPPAVVIDDPDNISSNYGAPQGPNRFT